MTSKTKEPKAIKMYLDDPFFVKCCKAAEIQPTRRQFKKYIDRKGKAYNVGKPALESEEVQKKEAQERDARIRAAVLGGQG